MDGFSDPDTNHGGMEYLPKNDWAMDLWGFYVGANIPLSMVRIWD